MIAYVIKSSLCLLIMFGLYWLLLRKEKTFIFNRYYLIFSIIISLVNPLISIPINIGNDGVRGKIVSALNSNVTSLDNKQDYTSTAEYQLYPEAEPLKEGISSGFNIMQILLILYASGVILLLFRFIRNIVFISRLKRLSEMNNYAGHRLALIDQPINPYCFFNTIFVNKQDYLDNKISKELLAHEEKHIKQSHSIDVIFIEIVQILYWFNPVLILYNRSIRINHEYLADNNVIRDTSDLKSYVDKLLNFVSHKSNIPLASGFIPSLTKKRLIMLTKSESKKMNQGTRIFTTINLAVGFFLIFGCIPLNSQPTSPMTDNILNIVQASPIIQKEVKGIVLNEDGKPIEGVLITNTGILGEVSTEQTGSDGRFVLSKIKEDASLIFMFSGYKTITMKPDFTSEMTVKMERDPDYKAPVSKSGSVAPQAQRKEPIVVVDGVISDKNFIDTRKALGYDMGIGKSIMGKEATDKYGEKGTNGVFEIITRKKALEMGLKPPFPRLAPEDYPTFQNLQFSSFVEWIASQAKYPVEARAKNIEGWVSVNFTVELDGSLSNVVPTGVVDAILTNEIIRIIQSSPKWDAPRNPAVDEPFSSSITLKFKLPDQIIAEAPFVAVEQMPVYPEGDAELFKFIYSHIVYPEAAKAEKIEGRVILRFIISPEGNVEGISIVRGVHPLLDNEAVRVLELVPPFRPGMQGGKAVNVWYSIPVTFKLATPEPKK